MSNLAGVVYEIGTAYLSRTVDFNLNFWLLMFLVILFLVPNVSCVTGLSFLECPAVFTDVFV